ncbi:phage portal protein, partial [Morganella morganii subsp. morganii]|nr:phage portal protein [Morganella morganii subsp. morganii]MBT0481620.1 phage portal protein [Morganella morganii subsp. morganii]MBT0485256.1 phage portal protein [Morganella morganii subsp. morganii]
PNECRELEELNPREGGDIWLTPMNMTTKPESSPEKEEKQDVDND